LACRKVSSTRIYSTWESASYKKRNLIMHSDAFHNSLRWEYIQAEEIRSFFIPFYYIQYFHSTHRAACSLVSSRFLTSMIPRRRSYLCPGKFSLQKGAFHVSLSLIKPVSIAAVFRNHALNSKYLLAPENRLIDASSDKFREFTRS